MQEVVPQETPMTEGQRAAFVAGCRYMHEAIRAHPSWLNMDELPTTVLSAICECAEKHIHQRPFDACEALRQGIA